MGATRAAAVYKAMLADTVARAVGSKLAPVRLCCAPDTHHCAFAALRRSYGVALQSQGAGDLGQRMQLALAQALRDCDFAVLVGADIPAPQPRHLHAALAALQAGADVVLGPACDGGYALIGLRRPAPRLFRALPWGSSAVLPATRARLQRLGLGWQELAPVADLDNHRDYLRAKRARLLPHQQGCNTPPI
ncbi:MAG: TIGR04282 family arsenosugar biosynthesis glycosyltransferase [Salinisphaera sp.]|nr:TIGR04282 family arsenosugar biosynthesis glycosyltransferase [Salinisphaera sp.]